LRLQPYRQKTLALRKCLKLSPRFYGPFQVTKKIGKVAYCFDLPPESRIHFVFHVSCLRRKLGQRTIPLPTLLPVDNHGKIQPEPEQILQRRVRKLHNQAVPEALIHWKSTDVTNATWEDL
jgi:hypothetical protein